jgi:hypothetical protein
MGLQYLLSEEGQFLRRQIILALTEDDRLHTAEVQRLWQLVQADFQPNRLVSAALGAIADFSGEVVSSWVPWAGLTPDSKQTKDREPQMAVSGRR